MWPVLKSPLLSLSGKARLLAEYFVPALRTTDDESLASFARRRLGREAFERLVQPLAAGIYTADPEKLSLAATMPRFLEMERQHGGLIRAVRNRGTADVNGAPARGAVPATACLSRRAQGCKHWRRLSPLAYRQAPSNSIPVLAGWRQILPADGMYGPAAPLSPRRLTRSSWPCRRASERALSSRSMVV